ncbi:hypothetical protein HPB48_015245 [Haemaphysalis longicornis]|uniref:poly(A)-specific ribonuclease n=1 Tax=Haemaphysalis longicornis TaxID=44386 RepID=A0A9J6FK27_HAELO|nr:hypothetical protein HPB48_015245 [Haemaphysalis longicornis]
MHRSHRPEQPEVGARTFVMPRPSSGSHSPPANEVKGPRTLSHPCTIREVWASNLDKEFDIIMHLVQRYNYVAVDTEFPGVLVTPPDQLQPSLYQYSLVRENVNLMKLVQLGLSFFDENGQRAPECCAWQFNFKFNVEEDAAAEDSIRFLRESGIQFHKHQRHGIDHNKFAERCTTSGVVLSDTVKCLVFHGAYDFGYLLKVLTGQDLPEKESDFFELLGLYFPAIYDVKCIMNDCPGLWGGLQNVANNLEVARVGSQHQAGSDSLLTGAVFFRMRQVYFAGRMDDKYSGQVSGLGGVNFRPHSSP